MGSEVHKSSVVECIFPFGVVTGTSSVCFRLECSRHSVWTESNPSRRALKSLLFINRAFAMGV